MINLHVFTCPSLRAGSPHCSLRIFCFCLQQCALSVIFAHNALYYTLYFYTHTLLTKQYLLFVEKKVKLQVYSPPFFLLSFYNMPHFRVLSFFYTLLWEGFIQEDFFCFFLFFFSAESPKTSLTAYQRIWTRFDFSNL